MAPTSKKRTDFARSQMLKFGWTDGKGLGKNCDGISVAVKAAMKFDKTGVGHAPGEEYKFEWWNHVFNTAANSIQVDNGEENVELKKINDVKISTKKPQPADTSVNARKEYGFFVKGANNDTSKAVQKDSAELATTTELTTISGDALYRKCGNLTAHKAARHGSRLSGKLRRLHEQESAADDRIDKELSNTRQGHKRSKLLRDD